MADTTHEKTTRAAEVTGLDAYAARYDVPGAARYTISPTPVSGLRRADRTPLRYPLSGGQ